MDYHLTIFYGFSWNVINYRKMELKTHQKWIPSVCWHIEMAFWGGSVS